MSVAEKILELRSAISALAAGSSGGDASYYTSGLEFERFGDGYAVVGRGTAPTSGTIRIPPTHNGLPVTKIKSYGCTQCENIIVPDSVVTIEEEAFRNVRGRIYIPKSVTTVTGSLQGYIYYINGDSEARGFYVEWTSKPSGWAENWNVYTEVGEGDFTTYTRTGCITDLFTLNDR